MGDILTANGLSFVAKHITIVQQVLFLLYLAVLFACMDGTNRGGDINIDEIPNRVQVHVLELFAPEQVFTLHRASSLKSSLYRAF